MNLSDTSTTRSRGQISLWSLLVACTLVAVACALGGTRADFLIQGVIAAAVAGGLPLLFGVLPRTLGSFLLGSATAISITLALQCFTFESTFGSYVYDGIPIAGWPHAFATGEGQFPPRAAPADMTLFGGHYWSRPNELQFDLQVCLAVSLVIGLLCIRPRAKSANRRLLALFDPSKPRLRMALQIVAWMARCSVTLAVASWLVSNRYFYETDWVSDHDLWGTWLHWLTLCGLAFALPLPVCFPAHRSCWNSSFERINQKFAAVFKRSIFMAVTAMLLCVFMLRGALWIGAWQSYYLNLPVTWTLLAIGLVLGGSFAWPVTDDNTHRRSTTNAGDSPTNTLS